MIPGPNWTRRYGAHMRRLCARPGCGSQAAATLRFQPTQREAWLVDLDGSAARTEGDLCARHASALVLPRGWQLHDERVADAPPQPTPAPRPTRGASIARARRRRAKFSDPALPGLAAVPEPEPVAVPEPEPVPDPEPEVAAPEPVASSEPLSPPTLSEPEREDLADTLDAQTPMLRRAFQNVWPFEPEN